LLENKANPNIMSKAGRTALMYATNYGYQAIMEDLLKHKANPNMCAKNSEHALIKAAENVGKTGEATVDIMRLLVRHGGRIDTSLCEADGFEEVCMRIAGTTLLERPSNVNSSVAAKKEYEDYLGKLTTPVMKKLMPQMKLACEKGDTNACESIKAFEKQNKQ
jgi:hypothetical protein